MEEQILNKMKSGFLYEKCNKVFYLYIFLQTLPETFTESYLGIPENKNFREKTAKFFRFTQTFCERKRKFRQFFAFLRKNCKFSTNIIE